MLRGKVGVAGFEALRAKFRSISRVRAQSPYYLALGPCAVESERQLRRCAEAAVLAGAKGLRGGGVKLRTSPDSFQGLGSEGFRLLNRIAHEFGLESIAEVTDFAQMREGVCPDVVQIGARMMWNFSLLEAAAGTGRTILLKRGMGSTTLEWTSVAERLITFGAREVVLVERGDRHHDETSRNMVDLSTLVFLARNAPYPIWLDVSHSSGDPEVALALLQLAPQLGLDGAMAEIHPNPAEAACDGFQAIPIDRIVASFAQEVI